MHKAGAIFGMITLVAVALGPGSAIAGPQASPRPMDRPVQAQPGTATGPNKGAVAMSDGALSRPMARPETLQKMTPATSAAAASLAARLVDPARTPMGSIGKNAAQAGKSHPDNSGEMSLAAAAVPPVVTQGPMVQNRSVPGALCGIPGLVGRKIAPITSKVKGCGLPDGVEVTQVSGLPLSIPIQVDCATAGRFKYWVDNAIIPTVGNRGGGLSRLEIAGSYACRPRNNQVGAKVSEHGRGHAVDLRGLKLKSGEVLTVSQNWRSRPAIFQQIHDAACGPFSTVLGPNSDRFHQDHIHVDTASGRGPYCR